MQHVIFNKADIGRHEIALVRDVSLVLEPGKTVLLSGKNGVGKTTFLHTILGYLPVLRGERGSELPHPGTPEHQTYFGYMPSAIPRLPSLTLEDWLKSIALGYRLEFSKVKDDWDRLGGRSLPNSQLAQLSSGNLRKAIFVGACAIRRQIVILDEPLDEVDKEGRSVMAQMIEEQKSLGASVLLVSHTGISDLISVDLTYELSEGRLNVVEK